MNVLTNATLSFRSYACSFVHPVNSLLGGGGIRAADLLSVAGADNDAPVAVEGFDLFLRFQCPAAQYTTIRVRSVRVSKFEPDRPTISDDRGCRNSEQCDGGFDHLKMHYRHCRGVTAASARWSMAELELSWIDMVSDGRQPEFDALNRAWIRWMTII